MYICMCRCMLAHMSNISSQFDGKQPNIYFWYKPWCFWVNQYIIMLILPRYQSKQSQLSVALAWWLVTGLETYITLKQLTTKLWILTQESLGKSLRSGTKNCIQPFQWATSNIRLMRFVKRITDRVIFRICQKISSTVNDMNFNWYQ